MHRVWREGWASGLLFPITDAGIEDILNKCPKADRADIDFVAPLCAHQDSLLYVLSIEVYGLCRFSHSLEASQIVSPEVAVVLTRVGGWVVRSNCSTKICTGKLPLLVFSKPGEY